MARKIKTLGFYGGKRYIVPHLLKLMPPHKLYVELFGGGAALLFSKPPSPIEVYNDIDSNLVNLFRVLRDDKLFPIFLHKLKWTLYSREEWRRARKSYRFPNNPVERAVRFFITVRQSFSKQGTSWAYGIEAKNMARAYFKFIKELDYFHQRLENVQIENLDWYDCLKKYNIQNLFMYMDPPYIITERRSRRKAYSYDFSIEDHEKLVEVLINEFKGKGALSGYKNEIYARLEKEGWTRIDIEVPLFASGGPTTRKARNKNVPRPKAVESIWINYQLPSLENLI